MNIPAERSGDAMSVNPAGQLPVERGHGESEFEVEFAALFREKFRKLAGVALSLTGVTLQEAEDAAETALQQACERWPTLTNPGAWVYKATISNVMKIKRKQAREARAVRSAQPDDCQPAAREDPGLMEVEYRQWVMSVLDSLPPAQREAVALCLIDELSPAEAGELLGKSGAALRQALHAGREALKRHLAGEPATEPTPTAGASTTPAPMAGRKEVR
jgi:RNA polymerase sigma-70 factor (ECF subfamily)